MISELTKRQFNVCHVVVVFFVVFCFRDELYVTAAIVFVMGAIFCALMDKFSKKH